MSVTNTNNGTSCATCREVRRNTGRGFCIFGTRCKLMVKAWQRVKFFEAPAVKVAVSLFLRVDVSNHLSNWRCGRSTHLPNTSHHDQFIGLPLDPNLLQIDLLLLVLSLEC